MNLSRMVNKTSSNLLFSHIRATISGDINQQNCHPFQYKRLMFMHNGGIGGWAMVKREIALSVADQWFSVVRGNTDSEWIFAVFLDSMQKIGACPSIDPGPKGFNPAVLRQALLVTIQRINSLTDQLPPDETRHSRLNFAVSDGMSVICTRYSNSKLEEPTSLFFTSGTDWKRHVPTEEGGEITSDNARQHFRMHRSDKTSPLVVVSSEPLSFFRGIFFFFFLLVLATQHFRKV